MYYLLLSFMTAAFLVSCVTGYITIPFLRRLKVGQSIREIGPSWHNTKAGTPTMGGIIFVISTIAVSVIMYILSKWDLNDVEIKKSLWVLLCASAFGVIGFVDDYIKVVLKRNMGLTAKQKFTLQLLIASIFTLWAYRIGIISTEVIIPIWDITPDLGIWFIPFTILVLVGAVNSVNLTDGLDGLASGVTVVVCVFFSIVLSGAYYVSAVSAILAGALLGFLIFNKYPAKVFMGDTGSLFLGGAVAAIAIVSEMPLILLIIGFVYIIEALSVIIQVTFYKLTGKRIFKMSPIHHHFEMCGWSEKKIVSVFTLITMIAAFIAYLILA